MNSLYSLPDLAIVLIFCGVSGLIMAVVPRLVRRVAATADDKDGTEFAVRAQSTLMSICTVVLAFALVQAQSNFRKVEQLVAGEASHINQLDRLLARYGDPSLETIRQHLRTYAKSVVNDEWPELHRGVSSPKTGELFAPISRGVLAISPQPGRQSTIHTDMVKQVDGLAEAREARIEVAHEAVSPMFWRVIGGLLALMVVLSCLMEQTLARSMGLCGQVMAVSALVALVFITDRPFMGQTSVGPEAITKAITAIEARKS